MANEHILVVGFGSIGLRHAHNLSRRACRISIVDVRQDRLNRSDIHFDIEAKYQTINEALKKSDQFNGAIIATPTKYHVPQIIMVAKYQLPTLIEKPLAIDLKEAKELFCVLTDHYRSNALFVGYTWRWNRSLRELRRYITEGSIGKVLRAQFTMSAHLADWHPWEPYQEFFMASKDLGGGALLDESHWIDQMVYLFGLPDSVFALIDKVSCLEIDSDDTVDILAKYHSGLTVSIHLDLYARPHDKEIKVIGERGSIFWKDRTEGSSLRIFGDIDNETMFSENRNVMFEEEIDDFLSMLRGSTPRQTCGLSDGYKVMRVIEAARASARERQVIDLLSIV